MSDGRMTTKQLTEQAWLFHPHTFRNNRGQATAVYTDKHGTRREYRISFGIPTPHAKEKPSDYKGGDRIGWTTVEITPDMVGQTVAVFTNIEIKGPGDKLAEGQRRWHNLVLEHGGVSEVWYADGTIVKEHIDET